MKQRFNSNPRVEFLHFKNETTFEAIKAFESHYHLLEIPDKYYKDGKYGILLSTLSYTDETGRKHYARRGLVTDGLSVPRVFWARISAPWQGRFLPAGLIHDSLCGQSEDVARIGCIIQAKELRKKADVLFHKMLRYLKASRTKAWLMFKAVRIGSVKLRFLKK